MSTSTKFFLSVIIAILLFLIGGPLPFVAGLLGLIVLYVGAGAAYLLIHKNDK